MKDRSNIKPNKESYEQLHTTIRALGDLVA